MSHYPLPSSFYEAKSQKKRTKFEPFSYFCDYNSGLELSNFNKNNKYNKRNFPEVEMRAIRKIKWTMIFVVIMVLIITSIGLAASVAIDTFDFGSVDLVAYNSDGFRTATSFVTNSAIIGNERDAQLSWVSGGNRSTLSIDFLDDNILSFAQGPGQYSRVMLQYDGEDASMNLDYTGLGGYDLTQGITNDSFIFRVIDNNLAMLITMDVYTNASNWSRITFLTPGLITGDVVDIVIPFTNFIPQTGAANFQSVGALEITIDGTIFDGSDLSLDFFEADSVRDFGDLPDDVSNYTGLTLLPTGARHIPNGLRLGPNIDANLDTEADGFPNARAGMDQTTFPGGDDGIPASGPNDEDGITRDMSDLWAPGNTVRLDVSVYGCPAATCYLNGWIDWNGNGSFADTSDQVFANQGVTNGINVLPVIVPGGYIGDPVFSRFRLCSDTGAPPDGCNSTTGESTSGEVEDYWWGFGPNAIELTTLEAQNNTPITIAAAGALLLLVSGGLILVYKRSRA